MKTFLPIAVAMSMTIMVTAAVTPQTNMATTQAFLNIVASGNPASLCGDILARNATLMVRGDAGFIPIAQQWAGDADCLGFQMFGAAAARYSAFDHTPTGGVIAPVAATATESFAVGQTTVKIAATGQQIFNMSAALHFSFDNMGNISFIDAFYDTSALAQGFCKSGALTCSAMTAAAEPMLATTTAAAVVKPTVRSMKSSMPRVMPGSTEASNLATLQSYWNAIFHGNLSAAAANLDSNVVTNWHGQRNIVPIAGTWRGKAGWMSFLTGAIGSVSNFTLSEFSFDACTGAVCVATWKEHSYTLSAGRAVDGLINFAVYTFSPQSLITKVDVYLDSFAYAVRFCAGVLVCK